MKRLQVLWALGLLGVLLLSGCLGEPGRQERLGERTSSTDITRRIYRVHDEAAQVTCWSLRGGEAIACLPDAQVAEAGRR